MKLVSVGDVVQSELFAVIIMVGGFQMRFFDTLVIAEIGVEKLEQIHKNSSTFRIIYCPDIRACASIKKHLRERGHSPQASSIYDNISL